MASLSASARRAATGLLFRAGAAKHTMRRAQQGTAARRTPQKRGRDQDLETPNMRWVDPTVSTTPHRDDKNINWT